MPAVSANPEQEASDSYLSSFVLFIFAALLTISSAVYGMIYLRASRKITLLEGYNNQEDVEKAKEVKTCIAKMFGDSN